MWEIWANLLLPQALKSCPKSNLVTLITTHDVTWPAFCHLLVQTFMMDFVDPMLFPFFIRYVLAGPFASFQHRGSGHERLYLSLSLYCVCTKMFEILWKVKVGPRFVDKNLDEVEQFEYERDETR